MQGRAFPADSRRNLAECRCKEYGPPPVVGADPGFPHSSTSYEQQVSLASRKRPFDRLNAASARYSRPFLKLTGTRGVASTDSAAKKPYASLLAESMACRYFDLRDRTTCKMKCRKIACWPFKKASVKGLPHQSMSAPRRREIWRPADLACQGSEGT